MTISATNGYLNASHHLLDQARSEFDSGDLRQASEKGWGAAAQIVKAVAEQRGWEHSTHRLLFKIVNDLAEETGDNELVGEFGFAHNLHVNFYENWFSSQFVGLYLDHVQHFIRSLESLSKP